MSQSTPPAVTIRSLLPEDEDRLLEICYLTGTTSLDKYLFGLRWCLYYLWHQPENSFVAVDQRSGLVLGYILGALDTPQMEKHFRQVMVPLIRKSWRKTRHKTLTGWKDYLKLLASSNSGLFKELYTEYPAHLHINIHPDHQRKGLGYQLIRVYEANLINKQVPGYHLLVGGDNQAGISFYRKIGLTELKKVPSVGKSLVIAFGKK